MRVGGLALGSVALLALTGVWRANSSNLQSPQTAAIENHVTQNATPELAACPQPNHHDGDALRCGYHGRSMRLYAIDAPEMPGACRPGRWCVPGDPLASRDHLAGLTAGRTVTYRIVASDRYGRPVVQAFADGQDLSCTMVRDGFAIERYGHLRC